MKYNFEKLFSEVGVKKYLTPASEISNTWQNNSDWLDRYNASQYDVYKSLFDKDDFDMDAYNQFLGTYYDMMNGAKYSGDKAKYWEGTNAYLKAFDNYGFHTDTFKQGWGHVDKANNKDRFDENGTWAGGDEYVGAMTARRRSNAFTDDELAKLQEIANPKGYRWILDDRAGTLDAGTNRKFYKLEKIPSDTVQEEHPGEGTSKTDTTSVTTRGHFNIPPSSEDKGKDEDKNKKPRELWTDWVPLTANLWNDLISADRQAYWKKKRKFALQEAPWKNYKITDDYYGRTRLAQQASEVRNLALKAANSSDLNKNLSILLQGEDTATKYLDAANLSKSQAYNNSQNIGYLISNENNLNTTNTANQNRQTLAVAANNILQANAERDLRRTAAFNLYNLDMYSNLGEFLKTKKLNELASARNENMSRYNADLRYLWNQYDKDWNDYKTSDIYKSWKNNLSDEDIEALTSGHDESYTPTDEDYDTLWNAEGNTYRQRWEKAKIDAYKKLEGDKTKLDDEYYKAMAFLPEYVTNQTHYYPGMYEARYKRVYSDKRGGTLRNSRLIDWHNHYLKELHSVRKNAKKNDNDIQSQLKRDLDSLDRETLLLLRSVFK